jgi:hypothetical protein
MDDIKEPESQVTAGRADPSESPGTEILLPPVVFGPKNHRRGAFMTTAWKSSALICSNGAICP